MVSILLALEGSPIHAQRLIVNRELEVLIRPGCDSTRIESSEGDYQFLIDSKSRIPPPHRNADLHS